MPESPWMDTFLLLFFHYVLKTCFFSASVESFLLYRSESWTLTTTPEKQLDSCYTRQVAVSLRSKRFQSSYCVKVRAGAFPFFLLTSQLFSTNSRGNACYAGWWRIQGRGPDEPVPPLPRVWMAGPPFSRSGWIRHWRLLLAALNISRRDHIFNKKLYRDMPPISTHLVNILIYNARNIFQLALTFATNY